MCGVPYFIQSLKLPVPHGACLGNDPLLPRPVFRLSLLGLRDKIRIYIWSCSASIQHLPYAQVQMSNSKCHTWLHDTINILFDACFVLILIVIIIFSPWSSRSTIYLLCLFPYTDTSQKSNIPEPGDRSACTYTYCVIIGCGWHVIRAKDPSGGVPGYCPHKSYMVPFMAPGGDVGKLILLPTI